MTLLVAGGDHLRWPLATNARWLMFAQPVADGGCYRLTKAELRPEVMLQLEAIDLS